MSSPSLFGNLAPEPAPSARPAPGPFAQVAIEQSLDQVLDYSVPPKLVAALKVGQRVRVPLGRNNRPTHGFVVAINPTTGCAATKPVLSIEDERTLVSGPLLELALWMSRYYCTPLGAVLDTMIPSAVKKKVGIGYTPIVHPARDRQTLQEVLEKTRPPKRRAVLARLLQVAEGQSIDLLTLASEAGTTPATVRKLAHAGLISIHLEPDLAPLSAPEAPAASHALEPEIALNEDQARAFAALRPAMQQGGFTIALLHGVTGSGKTEVYLHCIREVLGQGRQAIVLVPEIALTPQTVRRFTARFPRVAILHSGLSATQRHRFWQQIASGSADVVVGARSAIFAPLPRLGCIVVDEEHEGSYKQDSAPRYHARDVAIKRAQLHGVPIILGSATPSLETYQRIALAAPSEMAAKPAGPAGEAKAGISSCYLVLPRRVRDLAMPAVELVNMRQELRLRRHGVHLLSTRLEHLLRTTVESGQQAILLLNRRGYANFVHCPSCGEVVQCKYCDATMTYHRYAGANARGAKLAEGIHTGQLHCHYCLAVNPLPEKCPTCGKKLTLFGLGTQRVEEELSHKFPGLRFARVDGDTMHSARDYEATLGRFGRGEVQVLLGTQMIAKGLDYPNVTLVGVISGDTALALPDFRAAERTFQLITQVAGRAGRGDAPGRVVVQTFLPDDPTIRAALRHDYEGFARAELQSRREVGLPPVTRMVRIILRDQDAQKLHAHGQQLAGRIAQAAAAEPQVTVKGPMPCAITRIAGYHRAQVLLFAPTPAPLQRLLAAVRRDRAFAAPERVAVDVDPISLL